MAIKPQGSHEDFDLRPLDVQPVKQRNSSPTSWLPLLSQFFTNGVSLRPGPSCFSDYVQSVAAHV